jgi:hypothetical protein
MPKLRTSFARGFVSVISTPVLVLGVAVVLILLWVVLLAAGFQGPFAHLGAVFAAPPIGTLSDGALSGQAFADATLFAFLGFVVLRSLFMSLIATVSVERMRTGAVTAWSLRRALRVMPAAFLVNLISFTVISAGGIVASFLGPGLGLLAYFGALVGGLYVTAFVPVIAADEDRPLPGVMQRAFRVARMPGSGNLMLAALYTLPTYAVLLAPLPGSQIGVNPPATAWLASLLINLLHVSIMATFAFRYMSVSALVPEAPAPPPRRR